MRCAWEFPDGCRCEYRAVRDIILCPYHSHLSAPARTGNEGVKRYWLGSKGKRRAPIHVVNHGEKPVMVGAGWVAWPSPQR